MVGWADGLFGVGGGDTGVSRWLNGRLVYLGWGVGYTGVNRWMDGRLVYLGWGEEFILESTDGWMGGWSIGEMFCHEPYDVYMCMTYFLLSVFARVCLWSRDVDKCSGFFRR